MNVIKTGLLLLTVLIAMFLTVGALGQDDAPSNNPVIADLERARTLLLQAPDAQLARNDTYTETQTFTLNGDQAQIVISRGDVGTVQVLRADSGLNLDASITSTYERVDASFERDTYEALISLRFVDGVLYAQLSYNQQSGDVPTLPTGWRTINTASELPLVITNLDIARLLQPDQPYDLSLGTILAGRDTLSSAFTTDEVGETGEQRRLTLIYRGAEMAIFLRQSYAAESPDRLDDPFTRAMLDDLENNPTNTSSVTYNFIIDATGRIIGGDTSLNLLFNNAALDDILPGQFPEGTTVNLSIAAVSNTLVTYDTGAAPVSAPRAVPGTPMPSEPASNAEEQGVTAATPPRSQ